VNDLIDNKFNKENNLFLATKASLENYYKKVYFDIIVDGIPEKLVHTLKWAQNNDFKDAIIMKYKNLS
jgi:hypothetical protein